MPRKVTADVPSEGDILRYNNVPVELAAKFIGWSDVTIRYALQEERAPFGIAAQNPKTGTWAYNISPGLLIKYKNGELQAYKLKDLSQMLADHAERIIETRVGTVSQAIGKILGGYRYPRAAHCTERRIHCSKESHPRRGHERADARRAPNLRHAGGAERRNLWTTGRKCRRA